MRQGVRRDRGSVPPQERVTGTTSRTRLRLQDSSVNPTRPMRQERVTSCREGAELRGELPMAPVRPLNGSRPKGLCAILAVVVLFPLILGQSSAGGCGAAVSIPDPNVGANGTLDATIDDSDADGFSDDQEINSTPGTDPTDPTDNPINVRDSDGDGCSDFDELNFPNFCDNDPNTTRCATTYYNPDFHFGFDLPANAELQNADENEELIVFGRGWIFSFEGRVLGVGALVSQEPPQPLADFVSNLNQASESAGSVLLTVLAVTLGDDLPSIFTSLIRPDGSATYQVVTFANGYVYQLYSGFPESVPTEAADTFMLGILDSLCID